MQPHVADVGVALPKFGLESWRQVRRPGDGPGILRRGPAGDELNPLICTQARPMPPTAPRVIQQRAVVAQLFCASATSTSNRTPTSLECSGGTAKRIQRTDVEPFVVGRRYGVIH
jgi:hypothetical protein